MLTRALSDATETFVDVELIRELKHLNELQINFKRILEEESEPSIELTREIYTNSVKTIIEFVGIGQTEKKSITLDIQCCFLVKKKTIIGRIVEDVPLYVENTDITLTSSVFILFKPVNATGMAYGLVSDNISGLMFRSTPLYPDKSNKGYRPKNV